MTPKQPYTIDTAADLVEDIDFDRDHECSVWRDCEHCEELAERDVARPDASARRTDRA